VAERDRYVTPISYFTDRPLYLAIENLSSARANTTHVLEILVFALAILIVLASVFIFKGWREYSNAQATLRMHEQMLLEQSKFVSMGEISTILSHELNQPLATIETYSTASQAILAQAQPDQAKLLKAISAIRDETARISKIIKNIRSFIVNNQTQVMEIDAALLLDSLKTVLQMQAAHYQAQLVIEKKDSFTVEADRLMLEQVILNLSRNAFEAMRASPVGKRTLSIQIVREQNLGKLIFSDSGPGISAEVGAKLFTPFFSTKTDSMGIGLSLCRSLVERYQGQLHWQNNSLGGAQFTISFAVLERRQARDAVLDSSFSRRHAV
jgi:C4-dicarboxylate-specific signal transduction histidine kinase